MGSVLRSFLAIMAGVVVLLGLSVALTLLGMLAMHMKPGPPTTAYLTLNVVAVVVSAFCGGLATAQLAPDRPLRHAVIFAAVILVIGARAHRGYSAPNWYHGMMLVLPSATILVGASFARRRVPVGIGSSTTPVT